jgi:autoinducer 2-degrading protein
VLQTVGEPTRFLLVEIYRGPDAQAAHRETEHYKAWRDKVADMMAEPRAAVKYASLFPETL